MTDEKDLLVSSYSALAHATDNARRDSLHWVWEAMKELVTREPETAWSILLEVIASARTDRALAYIAAGALEDLLCEHGSPFIERVESLAGKDPKFRQCLTGVWGRNRMTEDVIQRLDALVEGEPPL